MELDPFDERDLYNKYGREDNNATVSTTISTIVVQGGPLQLVIALLRVRKNASNALNGDTREMGVGLVLHALRKMQMRNEHNVRVAS